MLIGYARVSKADGSQTLDLQLDALRSAGVAEEKIYSDKASGVKEDRPGFENCIKALRAGDVLVIWKLDRLGRSLTHLVNTIDGLNKKEIGVKVLSGPGAEIDTTTASGRLVFGIFASLAEFERELIRERTLAGLAAARARGRLGGRRPAMSKANIRLALAGMQSKGTVVSELCTQLNVSRTTLYRYISPKGELRKFGETILSKE